MSNDTKRRSAQQTGWLKLNKFKVRGYGVIQPDDGGPEVFCHISGFRAYGTGPQETVGIYNLEYRRRLLFRLAVDPRSDRICAVDVWPVREVLAPDGTIIELPLRGEKAKKQADAERAARQRASPTNEDGEPFEPRPRAFGELVAAINQRT